MMCDPQKDCRIQVFEYDGSGQQEEKRNIGLRIGLKKNSMGFFSSVRLSVSLQTGFSESDVGKPAGHRMRYRSNAGRTCVI